MKKLLFGAALLIICNGCKKEGICNSGCYDVPANFYFVIANNQAQSLFSSTADDIVLSYQENGQLTTPTDHYHPFKTMGGNADFICSDRYMAQKSEDGIKTFYLTYQGKTDTLGLDIHRVAATPDNGGNSTPVVTFDGRPMQSVPGGTNTPDYFVLKRR